MNRYVLALTLSIVAVDTARADQPAADPSLPPVASVERALAAYPPVKAARDAVRFEQANDRRLQAGPYEFAVRGDYQSHNIDRGRYPEWGVGLERAIRLPGKARVDTAIGAQGVELARRAAYSAWCDGARLMLKLWFAWARESVQLELLQQQAEFLRTQHVVVTKRARVGDAPRVEVNLAEASVAQAEASVAALQGREEGARAALERTFPALVIPARAPLSDPRPLDGDLDFYLERVRTHNDEVRVARALSKRARLYADRAAADLVPDPAIGARLSSDRSGPDRIAGVYIVVPIPGRARTAFSEGVRAQSDAALNLEAAVVQRISADVAAMVGQAKGAYAAWQRARAAAEGMSRNADSMVRSWQLKEASLSDVVIARRLAVESALSAALARAEAEESRHRLLIEAHVLWNDPEEEASGHDG
ncbi:MAG: TolC family protein [Burkholderiales bacterium]|nr:TolC family protein [Burkholderiales bacterium]